VNALIIACLVSFSLSRAIAAVPFRLRGYVCEFLELGVFESGNGLETMNIQRFE
jgi:hypothetical protein